MTDLDPSVSPEGGMESRPRNKQWAAWLERCEKRMGGTLRLSLGGGEYVLEARGDHATLKWYRDQFLEMVAFRERRKNAPPPHKHAVDCFVSVGNYGKYVIRCGDFP